MNVRRILALEAKNLGRERGLRVGLLLFLVVGAWTLYHGSSVVDRQQAALHKSPQLFADQLSYLKSLYPDAEAGELLFYLFFHTAHDPGKLAALSVGQRDVQSFNVKVRLLSLQGQLYDDDLTNPSALAAGTFDFAFLVVFISPLLVIALVYNVLSEEKEKGIWPLVQSAPIRPAKVLLLKLSIRSAVLMMGMGILFAAALAVVGIGLSARVLAFGLVCFGYLLFWVLVAAGVAVRAQSSASAAGMAFAAWLFLAVVLPSLFSVLISSQLPTPQAGVIPVSDFTGLEIGKHHGVSKAIVQLPNRSALRTIAVSHCVARGELMIVAEVKSSVNSRLGLRPE